MLVLGMAALLLLGGIATFLAARSGGNIFNVWRNITNEIIHNDYFTRLIASGATTENELRAIAEIRPFENGFIGISKETLSWEQAQSLAKRTGAEILSIQDTGAGSRQQLLEWLNITFASQLNSTLWVRQDDQARVLDGLDVSSVASLDGRRKGAFQWSLARARPAAPAPSPALAATIDADPMELLVDADFQKSAAGFPGSKWNKINADWQGGRYQLTSRAGGLWWPAQPKLQSLKLRDFVCEIEAQIPRPAEGSWGLGLVRETEPRHPWIGVQINSAGQAEIYSYDQKPLVKWRNTPALQAGAGWNTVRVEATGPRIRLSINDQFVVEARQEGRLVPTGLTLFLQADNPSIEVWIRRLRVWRPKG